MPFLWNKPSFSIRNTYLTCYQNKLKYRKANDFSCTLFLNLVNIAIAQFKLIVDLDMWFY